MATIKGWKFKIFRPGVKNCSTSISQVSGFSQVTSSSKKTGNLIRPDEWRNGTIPGCKCRHKLLSYCSPRPLNARVMWLLSKKQWDRNDFADGTSPRT